MNSISVVIPTHNRPELVKEALKSIKDQTLNVNEIIIVDDASTIPIDEQTFKKEFGNNIRVLRNNVSMGLAWCRHQGTLKAQSEFVAHLDDDDLYASETLKEGLDIFKNDPSIEIVFIGVRGFGKNSNYFNRVQKTAVDTIISKANGNFVSDDIIKFNSELLKGFFLTVPSAFQHVIIRRKDWHSINNLRFQAYKISNNCKNLEGSRKYIVGPLRDAEWALYSAIICKHTALLNKDRYLARCDGQGLTSQSFQKERHLNQNLLIRKNFFNASKNIPEFKSFKEAIKKNLAKTYFDASYYYFYHGNRVKSWKYIIHTLLLNPSFLLIKFSLRTFLPRKVIKM